MKVIGTGWSVHTFPTAASPRSTSFTLLLGLGAFAPVESAMFGFAYLLNASARQREGGSDEDDDDHGTGEGRVGRCRGLNRKHLSRQMCALKCCSTAC